MTKVLVTGASGYIGSHTTIDLLEQGYTVIGIDNQANSSEQAYQRIFQITGKTIESYHLDLRNKNDLKTVFEDHPDIKAVIHFAALKSVDESVMKPALYFENNIAGMINLLCLQEEYQVPFHIFSSSCTVYGNTEALPVTENTSWNKAESPYGLTKQIGEEILESLVRLNPVISGISLRYFNPAGAHPSGLLGEAAIKEVRNLIPLIMEVGFGKRESLSVYGNDYPTRDGTNVRDYIHIMDLAHAHTLALKYLEAHPSQDNIEVYNLGPGQGVSILEAIQAFERVTGTTLNYKIAARRPGDVVAIYADYTKAKKELGWEPHFNLDDIMLHSWNWEKNKTKYLTQ
ncbi:MAG: UDP-glucose 4-epimerase GalE [Saprospiraceae bacterium]